jgi:hypothetical protein
MWGDGATALETLESLRAEVELMATLSHRNIVQYLGAELVRPDAAAAGNGQQVRSARTAVGMHCI